MCRLYLNSHSHFNEKLGQDDYSADYIHIYQLIIQFIKWQKHMKNTCDSVRGLKWRLQITSFVKTLHSLSEITKKSSKISHLRSWKQQMFAWNMTEQLVITFLCIDSSLWKHLMSCPFCSFRSRQRKISCLCRYRRNMWLKTLTHVMI